MASVHVFDAELEGIFNTATFSKRPTLRPVLRDIINAAVGSKNEDAPTIMQLAQKHYGGKVGPVHVCLNRIRRTLDLLYESEWRSHLRRIQLAKVRVRKGTDDTAIGYIPEMVDNEPPIRDYIEYFWGDFLKARASNVIVISEPQFFRKQGKTPGDRVYVRSLKVNSPSHRARLKGIINKPEEWEPSHHYASIGEVQGFFAFLHTLPFLSVPDLAIPSTMTELPGSNLIVLGNPSINSVFENRQEGMNLQLNLIRSVIRDRKAGAEYKDREKLSSNGHDLPTEQTTYGLLTYNATERGTVLLIGGNHGRAIQGVCLALTDPHTLQSLCEKLTTVKHRLTSSFQVLFNIVLKRNHHGIVRVDTWKMEKVIPYPMNDEPLGSNVPTRDREKRRAATAARS